MTVNKYRKKPVVIEAIQYRNEKYKECNIKEVEEFVGERPGRFVTVAGFDLVIRPLEGDMTVNLGDYVIKAVNGEIYPCKPNIFEKTYDLVVEDAAQGVDCALCEDGINHTHRKD